MASDFFEFREKMTARPRSAGRRASSSTSSENPAGLAEELTVGQLTAQIDRALRQGLPESVSVRGELSNFSRNAASGHLYFTLKDADACLECVMWKSDAVRLKFAPSEGMELVASGRIGVYHQRGRYQLYATSLRPLGKGALELAFQQMRAKLEAEGLFTPDRKRPIPKYPRNIVLITSREAAALADVLKVLRRFSWLELKLYAVPVQGEGAGEKIAAAIRHVNSALKDEQAEVILLTRGGGSLEDLWAFNEEPVARAIFESRIPIITGIGHEVDVSIADLVADYHAHTPTEAAQVLTAHWRQAEPALEKSEQALVRALQVCVQGARAALLSAERHEFFRRPTDLIDRRRQLLDDRQRGLTLALQQRLRLAEQRLAKTSADLEKRHPRLLVELHLARNAELTRRLARTQAGLIERWSQQIAGLSGRLEALSPLSVLKRGYSMTTTEVGTVIRNAADVRDGDKLLTRLHDGVVHSVAVKGTQLELFGPSNNAVEDEKL